MTFSIVATIFTLAGLEILLSADNAVVLAALARTLPKHQQKKALFYGLLGAFVLRFICILCAQWIINFWFLQVIGGFYLVWLAIQHLIFHRNEHTSDPKTIKPIGKKPGFWGVIVTIELTDLAFAVDSILAAVALTKNLWVIYTGAMIGLIAMRFTATVILKLLEIFPALIHYAYFAVLWIGVKLTWQGFGHGFHWSIHEIPEPIFWGVMGIIILIASLHAWRFKKQKIS